jgi:endonuclease/exonuclease/phosphatase family metal-dependent hydrolase
MPSHFRIATFNCNNLFARPRIFAAKGDKATARIGKVAELQKELQKAVFDHAKIKQLKDELSRYIRINDIKGKHKTAAGAKEWLGWIEFKPQVPNIAAIRNTAHVIADTKADIVCLVEVDSRPVLQEFHDEILYKEFLKPANKGGYDHALLIDGNDDRGIDVALLSRFEVVWLASHIHETSTYDGKTVNTFSRDCLEVGVRLPSGDDLVLLINHLKSMGYSPPNDPQSHRRRRQQAKKVKELAEQYDLTSDYVVVAGDFNSEPDASSLSSLVGHAHLHNVNEELPLSERGTYRRGKKQLDYLLVSDPLAAAVQEVVINRMGMFAKTKPHYAEVKGQKTEASDHASVTARFTI